VSAAEGNSRLTAAAGLAVLVLFLLEIVTVLIGVSGVLSWHVVIGLTLLPPVLLKLASVTWRMVGYYRRRDGYRTITPPPAALRVLGPLLAVLTVALLGSGVALIVGPSWAHSPMLTLHKVSFYAWLVAVVLHVVPHFVHAVTLAGSDWARRVGSGRRARRQRLTGTAISLAVGALLAALLAGRAASYLDHFPHR